MRLCEMGFPMAQCSAALTAYNGNQEAALNALLSGTPLPVPGPPGTASGAAPVAGAAPAPGAAPAGPPPQHVPEKPSKPSGLFGRVWGSK